MPGTREEAHADRRVVIPLGDRLAVAAIGLVMCAMSLVAFQLPGRLGIDNPDDYQVVRWANNGNEVRRHANDLDMLKKKYGSLPVTVGLFVWLGWTVLAMGAVYSPLAPNRTEKSLAYTWSKRLPWRTR